MSVESFVVIHELMFTQECEHFVRHLRRVGVLGVVSAGCEFDAVNVGHAGFDFGFVASGDDGVAIATDHEDGALDFG